MFGDRKDTILWKYSKDGDFSTKSAYQLTNQGEILDTQFHGKWIWKLDILPKITNFLWLCMHGSIPVKDVLASSGINCDRVCPLCKCQDETILHLLRDYGVAREFWRKLEVPPSLVSSSTENLDSWLKMNCLSTAGHKCAVPWSILFLFAVWSLWRNGNNVVFDNTIPNPFLDRVCTSQAKKYFYCVSKVKKLASKVAISVSWTKPSSGWHKLNTDGASLGNPGKDGGGGLIRNCQGNWIKGFLRSMGFTTSVMAELWALRDGLYLAIQLGINFLEVELDAKVIVEMINNNDCSNRKHSLCYMIAGPSCQGSRRFKWFMFLERRINTPIFWLGGVAL